MAGHDELRQKSAISLAAFGSDSQDEDKVRRAAAPSHRRHPRQFLIFRNFTCQLPQISNISPAVPSHRGALRNVTDAGRDAVDAGSVGRVRGSQGRLSWTCERTKGARTIGADADGEVVWSWHPLLVLNRRRLVARPGLTNLNPLVTVAT